jgi:nucleotide-binding universal stress UspA family protein
MFDPLFSKILVAFDGSEPSKRALDLAAKTAAMFKGELIIVTVVPRVTLPIFAEEGIGSLRAADINGYDAKMNELYRISLEKAETEVRTRYPNLKFEALLLKGRPSATIVEEAEKRDANLIIIGSRGLGGIVGWILGSTSRNVVNQCTKPILIVK